MRKRESKNFGSLEVLLYWLEIILFTTCVDVQIPELAEYDSASRLKVVRGLGEPATGQIYKRSYSSPLEGAQRPKRTAYCRAATLLAQLGC